ncbi:unnamed protein product [Peronospora farinosa]|uniref:CST complex subunit STN1 n=1 Tax=Peronospora farinosa TaxID=134698 RepID=A0ABN8BXG5_9STRA|nr:unnamed protein product [Peronospora farinosa]
MRELGKDPLTWSFVKLFGVHVCRELLGFEGLPGSHAWRWKSAGLWKARLMTKAQCIGVVVSIVVRTDRVEFLVDDGTALIKTVLWGKGVQVSVVLGDLVHVEGKLNIDKNWDAVELSRELRILRITVVEDSNNELLHWIQVMELAQTYYSAASGSCGSQDKYSNGAKSETLWEDIATEAFFQSEKATDKNQRIRALQYTFRKLRRAGLLFLEDDAADRHILLSFEAALKPALLQFLREHSHGCSIARIADAILTRERFKCIPLQWIERSLEHLLASQLVVQKETSQLFFIH